MVTVFVKCVILCQAYSKHYKAVDVNFFIYMLQHSYRSFISFNLIEKNMELVAYKSAKCCFPFGS